MFVRIFAPRKFHDGLKVRWAYYDRGNGWLRTDGIALPIAYRGEEGWTGITYKQNYKPGEWKVNVETDDGRDIGNIRFTIAEDPSTDERVFVEELK